MLDTIIIGAGAAGIAAARRLHDTGRNILLLEAGDRIGGRAHTVHVRGIPLDLGCGWLHSAKRNPWTDIARSAGVAIDRSPARWQQQWHDLGFPAAEQAAFHRAWSEWEEAAHAALDGPDRAIADFVTEPRWRPLLDAISGFANGAPLGAVSLHDWAAYEDASSEDNWRLPSGYGALIAGHAAGLPIRLATPATRIDHRGATVRVETPAGTIEAARVIVAVPPTILADGDITFDPPLRAKRDAAANLPLGLADKVYLHIDGAHPNDAQMLGDPYSARTAAYRVGLFDRPVVEAFFGGTLAEEMEVAGKEAAVAFAVDQLVGLLGSDWRHRLTPLAATCWRHEPLARGSYSHARIGHAGDRAVLAAPVDDRLFFAGEACHPSDFSTAHGAYATGIAAADAIIALGA